MYGGKGGQSLRIRQPRTAACSNWWRSSQRGGDLDHLLSGVTEI